MAADRAEEHDLNLRLAVSRGERIGLANDVRLALEVERRKAEHKLGRGEAENYEQYLAGAAYIKALEQTMRTFNDVYARYLEEEDDNDE